MRLDTLKAVLTYLIALVVLVGTGILVVIDTNVPAGELLPFLTAVCGAVIAYVFAREQTQVVLSGNGHERQQMAEVSRRVDALALASPPPGSSLVAETIDVSGDQVNVTGGRS